MGHRGHMPPSKFVPEDIRNSMFIRALMECIGVKCQMPFSLVCYASGAEFLLGGAENVVDSSHDENISNNEICPQLSAPY